MSKPLDFEFVPVGGKVRVDGFCPLDPLIRFIGIAWIYHPEDENPLLEIPKPLGMRAIWAIMTSHAKAKNCRCAA